MGSGFLPGGGGVKAGTGVTVGSDGTISVSPWTSNVNAAGYNLDTLGHLGIGLAGQATAGIYIYRPAGGVSYPIYIYTVSLNSFGLTHNESDATGSAGFGVSNDSSKTGGFIIFGSNNATTTYRNNVAFVSSGDLIIGAGTGYPERLRVLGSNGNMGLGVVAPTHQLELSTDSAMKPTTNTWATTSDIRTKRHVNRFEGDIEVIRKLDPIVCEYNGLAGTPEGARVVGFDAEKLRQIVPTCVSSVRGKLRESDTEETDILSVNTHELFFHMLRAVQQLDRRLSSLQAQLPESQEMNGEEGH